MASQRFAVVLLLSALCIGAQAQKWTATLSAANQMPPITDAAATAVESTFTMEANADGEATFSLTYSGGVNVTMAHIHLGNATTSGDVVLFLLPVGEPAGADGSLPMFDPPMNGDMSVVDVMFSAENFTGPYEGATMEEFLQAADEQGLYVNLHTVEYPAGVARGQIMPEVGSGWEANLMASTQVPPLTEEEVGGATATFKLMNDGEGYSYELAVDSAVNMTMAHIHMGNATSSGGVVVILVPVGGMAGANGSLPVLDPPVSGSDTYTGSFTGDDLMDMNLTEFESLLSADPEASFYVNIHTTAFPGGAIRSQLFFAGTQEPAGMTPTPAPGTPPMGPTTAPAAGSAPMPAPPSAAGSWAGSPLVLAALALLAAAVL